MNNTREQVASAARGIGVAAGCILWLAFTGCRSAGGPYEPGRIVLPRWFSEPAGAEQADAPVSLGMVVPPHLQPLVKTYKLPGWIVYGTVRCLGSDEFLVNGTFKRFSLTDDFGESNVVVDELHYDVDRGRIESTLHAIASAASEAETELDRQNVLGGHVRKRFGGFLLFSLNRAAEVAGADARNLLMESGASDDTLEFFTCDMDPGTLPALGWRETASHYTVTYAGAFRYGDLLGSFRRTEEDAIHDLARSLLVKFSHMRRRYTGAPDDHEEDVQEEVVKEQLRLRLRGVRVTRRMIDMHNSACVVVVTIPRRGVARR